MITFLKRNEFTWILVFLAIAFLYTSLLPYESSKFDAEKCLRLNEDWKYRDLSGNMTLVDLPFASEPNLENGFIISRQLPKESDSHVAAVGLWTSMQYLKVFLNGEEIYCYCEKERNPYDYGKVDGSFWHVIRLPSGWEGSELVVQLTSPYPDCIASLKNVFLGTKASFLFEIIRLYGRDFLLAAATFFLGVLTLLAAVIMYKKISKDKSLSYLGWFQIAVSLWMFSECGLSQFLIGNNRVVYMMSYISLVFIPVPILIYLRDNLIMKTKWHISVLVHVYTVTLIGMTLLQFMDQLDFHEMLPLTHTLIVFTMFFIIVTAVYERLHYKNKEVDFILMCTFILGACTLIEIFCFYKINRYQVGETLGIGVIFCIVITAFLAAQKVSAIIRLGGEAKYFELLATLDFMTKCQNRTAFLKRLEELKEQPADLVKTCVIMVDLNYLKQVNDTLGHKMGDFMIQLCAELMKQTFEPEGECFRIGGDEFVCITHRLNEKMIQARINKIMECCKRESAEWGHTFQMAMGYAFYDSKIDRNLDDTMNRADIRMYEQKRKMKL